MNTFPKLFRQLLERSASPHSALAQQAQISVRTLQHWQSGQNLPRIPELNAVLDALQATPQDRSALLATLSTPRGARATQMLAANLVWPINTGVILSSLRMRRGFTLEQAAQSLGINRSTLLRWENMEGLPGYEMLDRLCDLLGITPEERALVHDPVYRNAATDRGLSLEELAHRTENIAVTVWRHCSHLQDYHFLTLLSYVQGYALHRKAARLLLARLHNVYAFWLLHGGHIGEAVTQAEAAARLSVDAPAYAHIIADASNILAVGQTPRRMFTRGYFRRGRDYILTSLKQAQTPLLQARLSCELSIWQAMAEPKTVAQESLKMAEAATLAVQGGDWLRTWFNITSGRCLLAAGRIEEGANYLPLPDTLTTQRDLECALYYLNGLVRCGDRSSASALLERVTSAGCSIVTPLLQVRIAHLEKMIWM